MLATIRKNKALRLFCAFMALYLLNCSVDTSDITPNYIPEDLGFNEQETIIEIVVEKVLGFENAIPENEDPDSENHRIFKKTISVAFYILPDFYSKIKEIKFDKNPVNNRFNKTDVLKTYFEIHSPPPEV